MRSVHVDDETRNGNDEDCFCTNMIDETKLWPCVIKAGMECWYTLGILLSCVMNSVLHVDIRLYLC